jgi:hypothetical protein
VSNKRKIDVVHMVPNPTLITKMVERFGATKYGFVTALNDGMLRPLNGRLGDATLVDVRSLADIVRQIHLLLGLETPRIATSRQFLSAIGIAVRELPTSNYYSKVAHLKGFHEIARDTIRELSHFEYTPTSLAATSEDLSPSVKNRVVSFAELWREVEATLERIKVCTASKLMTDCLDYDLDLDGQESRLLIFAESELNPLALKWFQWLVEQGGEVQIVFNRHATSGKIYESANKAIEILGVKASSPGEGNRLLNDIFVDEGVGGSELDWIEVHTSGDPLAECEWAVRRCLEIGESGTTGIVIRDFDAYAPLLLSAAKRHGLEINLRRRVNLRSNGFVAFVEKMFLAILSGDVRDLLPIVRSNYVNATKEERSEAESWINSAHDYKNQEWVKLAELVPEVDDENEMRRVLRSVFEAKLLASTTIKSLSDWHRFLKIFIEEGKWFNKVVESKTELRDQRAFTAMLTNLAQDASVNSTAEVTMGTWYQHATFVWDLSDVSVPSDEEGVSIVRSSNELSETDFVFALGLLEGSFPRRRREHALLSDADREELNASTKHPKLTNSFDISKAERDVFYSLCSSAKKGLYLSYPTSDGDSDSIPAFYIEEVKRNSSRCKEYRHSRKEFVPKRKEQRSNADNELFLALEAEPQNALLNEVVSKEMQRLVAADFTEVKPRDIRRLYECNFQYSASQLFPYPKNERDRWSSLLSIPKDAGLLTSETPEAAYAALQSSLVTKLDSIRPYTPSWEMELLQRSAMRLLDGWVQREFDSRELWGRDYRNTSLNIKFGEPGLIAERLKYHLSGYVDGLTTQNNVRTIHLYRRSVPEKMDREKQNSFIAEYGLMIASAWGGVTSVNIEIESLEGRRMLLVFQDEYSVPRGNETLVVFNLATGDGSKQNLVDSFKDLVKVKKSVAMSGQMPTQPNKYCEFCSYSDICRRSQDSSDEDDPFLVWGKS